MVVEPVYKQVLFTILPGGLAQMPKRAYEGDAGFDLFCSRTTLIPPGGFRDIPHDIAISLPTGYWGRITGRSSTFRKHLLHVVEGVIDNGYRGPLFSGVWNTKDTIHTVAVGDRVGQIIIQRIEAPEWIEVAELPESERGEKGFGSSG
jgi:dUTP pyrophosphatase